MGYAVGYTKGLGYDASRKALVVIITGSDVTIPVSASVDNVRITGSTATLAVTGSVEVTNTVAVTGSFTSTETRVNITGSSATLAISGSLSGTSAITGSITSVTPGTGSNQLGKAIDNVKGSADVGVALLASRLDTLTDIPEADGDYSTLKVSDHGTLYSDIQHHLHIAPCEDPALWAVLNNDTANLGFSANHVLGTGSITFDKVNGAGNTVFAAIYKTISSENIYTYTEGGGFILWSLYASSVADIDYAFIRLGKSGSYNEWRVPDVNLEADWNNIRFPISSPSYVGSSGSGWDTSDLDTICVGVAFDAENNTLSGITVDNITLSSGVETTADITAEVSSEVSSPNVNVKKWGSQTVTLNQGNSDTGTLRVAISDDDTNLLAIKTAVQGGESLTGSSITLSVSGSADATIINSLSITGSQATLAVTGSFGISGGSIGITGSQVTQAVSGSVSVINTVAVTGSFTSTETRVNITGSSATLAVTGSFSSGETRVNITGSSATLAITGSLSSLDGTSAISGSIDKIPAVAISGSSATLAITGSLSGIPAVAISGSSATLSISGSLTQITGTSAVTGSITEIPAAAISGSSATLAVTGSLTQITGTSAVTGSITEIPAIAISGSSTTLAITGSVQPAITYDHYNYIGSTDNQTIAAAVAGKVTKVHYIFVQSQGTVIVSLEDGSGGTKIWQFSGEAREGVVSGFIPYPAHLCQTTANTALVLDLSAAVTVNVSVIYSDEDAS